MNNDKTKIRQYIRNLKRMRTAEELRSESEQLMSLLEAHARFQKAHVVLAFYALPDEPETQLRLDAWAQEKKIILPVVRGDELYLKVYQGPGSLVEGAFHIWEPQGENFTDYASIDLVVVPGVAFDRQNNRLGRGKGYYDRLLCQPPFKGIYKLGMCFGFQKVEQLPAEPFDIVMNEVL